LENPAASGLLVIAKWSDRNLSEPGPDPLKPKSGAYARHYLDDAFERIDTWNKGNPAKPSKRLRLIVTPGFNSPSWVFVNYSTNDTKSIPYGIGKTACSWRHACIGDYVCVNSSQLRQVTVDSASFCSRVGICPPGPRPHCGPQLGGLNSCC
jgi:hypothetical protein